MGVPILYDVSQKDMVELQIELSKYATHCIAGVKKSMSYMPHFSSSSVDAVDREQIISDIYESEYLFQQAKVALINRFVFAYENCTDSIYMLYTTSNYFIF